MKTLTKTLLTALLIVSFQQVYCNNNIQGEADFQNVSDTDSVKSARPSGFVPYGLVNIFYSPVHVCQIAAIGNTTMDESSGFQLGTIFNTATNHSGMQLAGIVNTAGKASGIQIGGIINQSSQGNCVQLAGLINNAQGVSGSENKDINEDDGASQPLQISGLVNNSEGADVQLTGIANNNSGRSVLQVAGIINQCDNSTVTQLAGIANHCPDNSGIQVAGIVNYCKGNSGTQIAGIVNRSAYFKGVQIGLVNISDSCYGVPIGLINIVKKNGYFRIELSADEMFYANVGLRTGLEKIHGIVTLGLQPDNIMDPLWSTGFGIGSLIPINSKTSLGMDAIHQQVFNGHHAGDNYISKFNIGIDRKISPRISVYIGLSYNFLFTDNDYPEFDEMYDSIAPYYFTEYDFSHCNFKSWAGFKLGIRLF